mmetsp:Transcript_7990/g.14820  ORF Transcript_7990/g.14820 Transcript_7990/m.14820 type:complete len:323 (+) Transcript_7990:168-1136(+)
MGDNKGESFPKWLKRVSRAYAWREFGLGMAFAWMLFFLSSSSSTSAVTSQVTYAAKGAVRNNGMVLGSINVCVRDGPPQPAYPPHQMPSPDCLSFVKSGTEGDIYYPPNTPNAELQFKRLNYLVQNHTTHPECSPILNQVSLRNFRSTDLVGNLLYPAMYGDEMEMVIKTLINHRPAVSMEWGAGGSSKWYSALVGRKTYSVDNLVSYCEKVKKDPYVQCLFRYGKFTSECVNPKKRPEKDDWGMAEEETEETKELAKKYVGAIERTGEKRFDFVFVDGRYRVGCALNALNYIDEKSIVVMHDFWGRLATTKTTTTKRPKTA